MGDVFRENILDGKVAFITGGGSGICLGITRALMGHGAQACIVGRSLERLQAASSSVRDATGRECIPVAADVRDGAAVEGAVETALRQFGRIDIVVNGAAGNFLAPASQLSYNGFKTVIDIDTIGTFNVSKAVFDRYLRQHGGNIINISATLHYGAVAGQIHAAAAKAAIDSITRTLALEWGGLGIRVNAIAPGPIEGTEGIARLAAGGIKEKLQKAIPISRLGRIEEIANVALFLASDASSLVHGAVIVADGGAWLGFSPQAKLL